MSYPMFAASPPDGDMTFEVFVDSSSATTGATVNLDGAFWLPSLTDTSSVWYRLLDAIENAGGPEASDWSATFQSTWAEGVRATLTLSGVTSVQIFSNGTDPLPLSWFGFSPIATETPLSGADIVTDYHPQFTWFPKTHINDFGWRPRRFHTSTAGPTASGATYTVVHESPDLGYSPRVPMWRHVQVDGAVGALGGLMQWRRVTDPVVDWKSPAGLQNSPMAYPDVFAALDAPGGFWRATVNGRPFVLLTDELNTLTKSGVAHVIVSDESPFPMDGWYQLGPPNVVPSGSGGGRRIVELAFLEQLPSTGGEQLQI